MTPRTAHHGLLLAAGLLFAACNLVTGADDIALTDADDDSSSSDDSSDSSDSDDNGQGGNGSQGGNGNQGGTGNAGGANSSGSGGAPTTTSSSSSGAGGDPTGCGGAGPATTPLDSEEQAFLVLINNYRGQNGLGSLSACTSLNRTAQGHSEDMRDQNYFEHTGLNGSSPWDRACDACYDLGCGPMTAMAENIAAGNADAQGTFNQWQNSPGHNANMLDGSFTQIGIGRALGGSYGSYWTNVFGGSSEPSCN